MWSFGVSLSTPRDVLSSFGQADSDAADLLWVDIEGKENWAFEDWGCVMVGNGWGGGGRATGFVGWLVWCVVATPTHATDALDAGRSGEAFLRQHWLRCHDEQKQEGSFRIDTLSRDFADPIATSRWAEVMTRINAGEKPPEEEPRPTRS